MRYDWRRIASANIWGDWDLWGLTKRRIPAQRYIRFLTDD
jgi:hypothetical protein